MIEDSDSDVEEYIGTEAFAYWFEWRHKCRKKAADARRFQSGANRFVPLNDLEIRLIELSGKGTAMATELPTKQLTSFLAEDSDSQPLENIKVQAVPLRKGRPRKSSFLLIVIVISAFLYHHNIISDERQSATPPPKWALDLEERRIAAEERMAAALESIASVMQSQEERRAMLNERIADALTTISGTVQDLNSGVQEALQHLHQINPVQTNGPDYKGNFML
ncbi:Uncharacterized protein OBRU01_25016 [Operophtera brumata]|uniref:Uncharacterized protein n=1 Tax=Operophtera brumata TaxID=104452 RepID=A0A0L7KIB9_OPEBR|nr:Uncharacterized protein OBRU01_25016 [Operophtera brumata]